MLKEKERLELGKYALIRASASEVKTSKEEQPIKQVHHLFIIDCSGSMYYELPRIRTDLYNKISTIMKPDDSVTIIWFSSRGEYGVVVEDFKMKSKTMEQLRDVIEKQLHPRGLTAFKDPLLESKKIISRITTSNKDMVHSLFFLTDGHDNQSTERDIISAINDLKPALVSAAIVEYGYYCNRKLLSEMSMEVGGVHVFAQDFQDYEPYLKKQFEQKVRSERKKVNFGKVHGNIVFSMVGEDVLIYKVDENGDAFLDVEAGDVFFLQERNATGEKSNNEFFENAANGNISDETLLKATYASMFAFSRKSDYKTISDILRVAGDAYFIRKKANTFGTQKINELEAEFLQAANNTESMFIEGYNPNLEPKEDAYCVMDMLDDLMAYDDNLWYPRNENFVYKRIGRKTQLASKKASKDQKEKLKEMIDKGDTAEALKQLQELEEQPSGLKFIYKDDTKGYPIHDLVWNNSRANLSVRVKFEGSVELPDSAHDASLSDFPKIPKNFDTHMYRNYTIIKDGIINTYRLPVSLNEETFNKLQANGLLEGETYTSGKIYVLDFSSLPVINQKMVKETSAEKLFRDQYALLKIQAKNTVFNHLKKAYFENVSLDFAALYGAEGAAWLKEFGLTPNGYNPKVTQEPSTEETMVNTLSVKIEKMTVPNTKKDFDAILSKIEKGMGLTNREKLLEGPIREFQAFEKMSDGVSDAAKKTLIDTWLSERSKDIRKEKTRLMNDISRVQFTTIVGKSWFSDLDSRDEKEMIIELDGEERKFVIADELETIKI
jgi:hypothetical protein